LLLTVIRAATPLYQRDSVKKTTDTLMGVN
jgi:hypothetical protein